MFTRRILPVLRLLVEVQVRFHDHLLRVSFYLEAELFTQALHGTVVVQDVGGYAAQAFFTPDFQQMGQQGGAEALALEVVADEHGELGLAPSAAGGC